MGSRDGPIVRALASNECGPGSISGLAVICGLSLSVDCRPCFERFFSGYSGFPSPQKTNITKSLFDPNTVDKEPSCRCATANSHLLSITCVYHRPECRDTSGTFTPFLARTFESSLAKVHKITKKVGQNRSAPLGSFDFTGKRLSLLVSVHMAFVEGMLIKQMRLFVGV